MVEISREHGVVSGRVDGPLPDVEVRRLVDARVTHLFVNSSYVDDLGFLARLPLRELDLVRIKPGTAITPVSVLGGLTRLNVATAYSGELEATGLAKLEQCFLEWGRGAESIAACGSLRRLYVHNFPGASLGLFGGLRRLEALRIGNARTLTDLSSLTTMHLRALGLYRCPQVTSLSDVPLTALVRFDAAVCASVRDWEVLAEGTGLRYIGLQNLGPVASIQPFARCRDLEFFWLPESTNVADGKVGWLADLPNLRATGFQDRRHYDAKRGAIERVVAARSVMACGDRRRGTRRKAWWRPPPYPKPGSSRSGASDASPASRDSDRDLAGWRATRRHVLRLVPTVAVGRRGLSSIVLAGRRRGARGATARQRLAGACLGRRDRVLADDGGIPTGDYGDFRPRDPRRRSRCVDRE